VALDFLRCWLAWLRRSAYRSTIFLIVVLLEHQTLPLAFIIGVGAFV